MVEIQGYYTSNACYPASPYASGQICDQGLLTVEAAKEGLDQLIIAPPLAPPAAVAVCETGDVTENLLLSGNYFLSADGQIRSVYFSDLIPSPKKLGEYLTPLIAGGVEDIKKGSHAVNFGVYYGKGGPILVRCGFLEVEFVGLQADVRIEEAGLPPIYVIDNHDRAYFAWEEARAMGYFDGQAALIHIDGHADGNLPLAAFEPADLAGAAYYEIFHLGIASFIWPAVAQGTVSEFWFFRREPWDAVPVPDKIGWLLSQDGGIKTPITIGQLLENPVKASNFILDLDLDALVRGSHYFSANPTSGLAQFRSQIQYLSRLARQARVVTIATSPGYADQDVAIALAREIVRQIVGEESN